MNILRNIVTKDAFVDFHVACVRYSVLEMLMSSRTRQLIDENTCVSMSRLSIKKSAFIGGNYE